MTFTSLTVSEKDLYFKIKAVDNQCFLATGLLLEMSGPYNTFFFVGAHLLFSMKVLRLVGFPKEEVHFCAV